jgi:hypothetical protein
MDQGLTDRMPAPERVGCMLRALYDGLDADERRVLDFILRQAVEHVAEQTDAGGYISERIVPPGAQPETQDAMKRVLFGAAGVTGGLATPSVINWLVGSARDANLFS